MKSDLITSFEFLFKACHPHPQPKNKDATNLMKLYSQELLKELLEYQPPSPPPHRGPGADWDAVCEHARKMLHARIDRIFAPSMIDFITFSSGMKWMPHPSDKRDDKYIIGFDPYYND